MNYLRVKVTPKSKQTELTGIIKENIDGKEVETYRIRLKSAPEKGKANEELIKFLSKHFNIPKENFSIIGGKTDRIKLIKIA